ncbi:MAG: hypothetical protein WCY82_10895, partial [Desulfotomaculaceae bacterium]
RCFIRLSSRLVLSPPWQGRRERPLCRSVPTTSLTCGRNATGGVPYNRPFSRDAKIVIVMNTASKLYSFIVVRIRMLILSAAKNLKAPDPSLRSG